MKKKVRNTVIVFTACLLVVAQIYLMPKIAPEPSKPPIQTESKATVLVFPLPSTINIQSNLMLLRTLFNEKTTPKSGNTEGVDSIKRQ
jgi:hypothetical protein